MASHDHATGEGATHTPPPGTRKVEESTPSTTAELFFDLVFVFAFIQVTTLMADDSTVRGVLHGLLVLTLLWWAWSVSAWVGNRIRADFGLARVGLLAVTTILFVLALATREAFDDFPGGLNGPVVFVACYLGLRLILVALRWYAIREATARYLVRLTWPMLTGCALLFAAAILPQRLFGELGPADALQIGLWVVAVAVDFGVGMAVRLPRLLNSARHWAERHGLIVIVALGESIIAIGLSSLELVLSVQLIWVGILGLAVAASLEWLYFDVVALACEQALRRCPPLRRVALARDAYTYLHLPMVAGIILYSLGLKEMISTGGEAWVSGRTVSLEEFGLYALYGGPSLFLFSHTAFQLRITRDFRTIVWPRLATAVLLVALIPVADALTALGSLGLLAACCAVLVVVEVVVADGQRHELREAVLLRGPEGDGGHVSLTGP